MSSKPQLSLNALLLFFLISVFAVLLTTSYISAEHVFYWWDYGLYMEIAVRLSRLFIQDPVEALASVYSSTRFDYNYFFAVPLIPFLALFRYSRLGFVLALVFVYHVPMLIVLGKIARRVFPFLPLASWIAVGIGLSTPVLWATVFRGLPDAGGVLFVGMAVLVYLKDMDLKRWQLQLPLMGILTGLSMIFRRHFVYNVAAFLSCVGLFLTYFSVGRMGRNWRGILREAGGIAMKMQILAAFLVLTIVVLAPGLLLNLVGVNYLDLYSSYEDSAVDVLVYFLQAGGVLWLFTGLGLLTSLLDSKIGPRLRDGSLSDKRPLIFCFVFGITAFLTWVSVPRQSSLHYVLHTALLLVMGTSAFLVWAWTRLRSYVRWLIISGTAALLALNLWIGLTPAPLDHLRTTQNFPPLYREDYDEVVRLVAHLREVAGKQARIYVVDSSKTMNNKILHNAEIALYGEQAFLNILHSPQIDSRDFYPLENLIRADYVVVTSPVQCHLREDEQRVVTFVHDIFGQGLPPADDFREMPGQFALENGAVLRVYERHAAANLVTMLATFGRMKQFIGRVPGGQPDWISITPVADPEFQFRAAGNRSTVSLPDASRPHSFLYVDTDSLSGRISGDISVDDESCAPIQIKLDMYAADGSPSLLSESMMLAGAGDFNLEFSKVDNTALVLTFQQTAGTAGTVCQPVLEWETIR
jgi:hypothetical protein